MCSNVASRLFCRLLNTWSALPRLFQKQSTPTGRCESRERTSDDEWIWVEFGIVLWCLVLLRAGSHGKRRRILRDEWIHRIASQWASGTCGITTALRQCSAKSHVHTQLHHFELDFYLCGEQECSSSHRLVLSPVDNFVGLRQLCWSHRRPRSCVQAASDCSLWCLPCIHACITVQSRRYIPKYAAAYGKFTDMLKVFLAITI